MYKKDLTSNNLQCLIYKNKPSEPVERVNHSDSPGKCEKQSHESKESFKRSWRQDSFQEIWNWRGLHTNIATFDLIRQFVQKIYYSFS